MRTKIALCLLVVSAALTAHAATVTTESAIPEGAQLEKYSIEKGPLSTAREAILNLHPAKLSQPWIGYNHYRGLRGGRWVLETLPAGTLVLEDANDRPIYKADCGNRLVGLPKCGPCMAKPAGISTNVGNAIPPSGFWSRHPWLRNLLEGLGALALGLLALAALILLLALLVWILLHALETLENAIASRRAEKNPPVTPPATASTASAQPDVTPTPSATPATGEPVDVSKKPAPGFVAFYHGEHNQPHKIKHGGFKHVAVTDHGDGTFTMHVQKP